MAIVARTLWPSTLPTLPVPGPWVRRAACADVEDPDVFFPPQGRSDLVAAAKAICERCTVREACLRFALETDGRGRQRVGVFGGLSGAEREALSTVAKTVATTDG